MREGREGGGWVREGREGGGGGGEEGGRGKWKAAARNSLALRGRG